MKQEKLARDQEPEKVPLDTSEISTLYKDKAVDLETGESKTERQVSKVTPKEGDQQSTDIPAKGDSNGMKTKPNSTTPLANSEVSKEVKDANSDQAIDGKSNIQRDISGKCDIIFECSWLFGNECFVLFSLCYKYAVFPQV